MTRKIKLPGVEHIRRDRYFVVSLSEDIILPEKATIDNVYHSIYEIAYSKGFNDGRKAQSQDILDIINKPFED